MKSACTILSVLNITSSDLDYLKEVFHLFNFNKFVCCLVPTSCGFWWRPTFNSFNNDILFKLKSHSSLLSSLSQWKFAIHWFCVFRKCWIDQNFSRFRCFFHSWFSEEYLLYLFLWLYMTFWDHALKSGAEVRWINSWKLLLFCTFGP